MQLNPKELLFGQPVLKIRQIIRKAMEERLCGDLEIDIYEKVAIELDQSRAIAKQVIDKLTAENYLVLRQEKSYNELIATEKGRRLGISKAIPPINRQKATQLLNELIDRAKLINANHELAFFVESIKLFGSYLTDKEVLGDLDVGIKLTRRKNFSKLDKQRSKVAEKNGRIFKRFVDKLCWSETEVWSMLKAGKRSLSIHNLDVDGVFEIVECKEVYNYNEL